MVAMPSFAADWTDANDVTYTALKSINGGGSGLIVTDFTPAGTEIVKFKYKPLTVSGNECVFCSRYYASDQPKAQFCGFRITSKFRFDRCDYYKSGKTTYPRQSTCNTTTLSACEEYSVVANFGGASIGTVTINDTPQTLSTAMVTDGYTPGSVLVLLASHTLAQNVTPTSSSTFGNKATGDLYYLQLWSTTNGTELSHNFMPALCDSDSTVGLYDTATRKFWPATIGSFTGAAYSANDRAGKKWTGLGADNKMSNGENWQGGVAPSAGDDLDFTIAVPFAAIDADIDATFGKVYLGTGDIPAFIGSLTATAVNDLTRMQAYDTATADFTFTLAAPTGQDFTWNGAAAANWWATDIWTYNSAASSWYDNNTAVFNTANATATLDDNVSANSLAFDAPATIGGAATLTVSTVSVAPNVSAVISAPTAGALEKTGAGTLTLGSSRTEQTTVSEGTLAMADGATVVPANLTLGSDSSTPVTFDYGGKAFDAQLAAFITPGANVTLTNIVHANSGSMVINKDNAPAVLTVAKDATLEFADHATLNTDTETTLNIVGGTVKTKKNTNNWLMQTSLTGRLNINVTDGGLLEFGGETYLLTCRDAVDGSTDYQDPSLYFRVVDSTLRVLNNRSFRFGHDGSNKNPVCPTGVFAATNSVIDVPYNILFGNDIVGANTAGSYTADFENCIVTARAVRVYHDRPLNAIRFNDTRFALAADNDNWLYSSLEFETEFGTPIKPITINAGGLVLDTNGHNGGLNSDPHGAGAITKVGDGSLYIRRNQTSSSPLVCEEGETYVYDGLSVARAVTVKSGAKFTTKGAGQVTLADIEFEAGAELCVDGYDCGVVPIAVTSLTLPASGTVTLTKNNNFSQGKYRILEKTGIAVADVQDKLVPATDNLAYSWSVEGNTLVLTVGNPTANAWTGFAGDGKMSTPGNWLGNVAPGAGDPADFSAANMAITVEADIDATLGAVTMGSAVVTFTGSLTATSFSDTTKVAVGENSTVTLDGDLELDTTSDEKFVAYKVDAGGAFRVTGSISGTGTKNIKPTSETCEGAIVAKGLKSDQASWVFRLSRSGGYVGKWVVGEDGLSGTSGFWIFNDASDKVTIQADANFDIASPIGIRTSSKGLTLNTTGFTDDAVGYTITAKTGFADNGKLTVAGKGTFLCDYVPADINGRTAYSGAVAVTNTATLAINPGKYPTTGAITVNSDATLQVAQSGTVTLGGNLTFKGGAALGFNYTTRNAPVLALGNKTVTFDEGETTNVVVKISAADGVCPISGNNTLTSGGKFTDATVSLADGTPKWVKDISVVNGDIVIDVKPVGLMVIFR